MGLAFMFLLSASIFIAGIIAAFRFKQIHSIYYPFLYCIWIGSGNEILSYLLIRNKVYSSLSNNIYVLLEALLISLFFKRFGLFKKVPTLYYCILTSIIVIWIAEGFVFGSIHQLSIYFRVFYSFVIVLMSIHCINSLITSSKGHLFKNPSFLLCIGFIVYFTYKVLIEAFFIYGIASSKNFQVIIFAILAYINLFTNLLYALATLWMPKRQAFTLPY